ncbi:hypothetical protein [Limosilactobacillus fermentum]|uniref:hypothetical protein n=1 Tax=Limosilactobacillus fermentum TaxID=1613 RepID=UPI0037046C51
MGKGSPRRGGTLLDTGVESDLVNKIAAWYSYGNERHWPGRVPNASTGLRTPRRRPMNRADEQGWRVAYGLEPTQPAPQGRRTAKQEND